MVEHGSGGLRGLGWLFLAPCLQQVLAGQVSSATATSSLTLIPTAAQDLQLALTSQAQLHLCFNDTRTDVPHTCRVGGGVQKSRCFKGIFFEFPFSIGGSCLTPLSISSQATSLLFAFPHASYSKCAIFINPKFLLLLTFWCHSRALG